MEGEEVVQLYIKDLESSVKRPLKSLRKIERISLKPRKSVIGTFNIILKNLQCFDTDLDEKVVEAEMLEIGIALTSNNFNVVKLEVTN